MLLLWLWYKDVNFQRTIHLYFDVFDTNRALLWSRGKGKPT